MSEVVAKHKPDLPTYEEYLAWHKRESRFDTFLGRIFTPDEEGYLRRLAMFDEAAANTLAYYQQPIKIDLNPDRPHGYILGTPGSGKSELLKLIVHEHMTARLGGVIVLDPSSAMVGQIARWREFNASNRLVYVTLTERDCPAINPLSLASDDYSEEMLNVKRVVAQELVEAIARIVSETSVTGTMKIILRNCLLALLDRPGSTLKDLLKFMDNDPELIQFAGGLRHHEHIADYFAQGRFANKTNTGTKEAIARRLDGLLSVGTFARFTCSPSTIDLEKAIRQKKVVLFDLGKGAIGAEEGKAIGRLIIAQLLGIAFRRKDKTPCTIVVDECHNYITDSMEDILLEARKYRISLILAQQIAGQRMPVSLRDAIYNAANLQIVGGAPRSGASRNADVLGVTAEEIRQLDTGEFFIRTSRRGEVKRFLAHSHLADQSNSVSKLTWQRMMGEQRRKYYRAYTPPIDFSDPDDVIESSEW